MFLDALSNLVDLIAPFYTIAAIIVILFFAKGDQSKEVRQALYQFVKPVTEKEDTNDPDVWKKKFIGSWTLLRREGIKEFLSGEGFPYMKVAVASSMGHQVAVTFEGNDVNGKCEINGTGVPAGTIEFCPMDKDVKTVRQMEGRDVEVTMFWDEDKKALIVDMIDIKYPVRQPEGRTLRITRQMVDNNTMETIYAQTNLKDNSACGYTGFMKRV